MPRSPARAHRRSASTRSRSSKRPSIRPRTPTSRCSCIGCSIRGSPPTPGSISSIRRSRCRRARCCSAWSAPACFSTAHCSTRRAASWASACLRSKTRPTSSPASRSISDRRSSWARSCSDKMKLPVVKKTATGQPSTDEDVLQQLAADYPLPKLLLEHRGLSKLKSTYTDKLPQMAQRAHRTRSYQFRPGDGGHRTARQHRSQSAEHSGAHARRPADSRGIHRAAGTYDRLGRLFADRAAHHGASVRRRIAAQGFRRRRRHSPRDSGRDIRRAAGRGQRPTSVATSRPSTSA